MGIGISDDYNIISVDEFTCDSKDAYVSYVVASSESNEDDYYESKKSSKRSLKEEAMTTKLFRFIQDLYDVHYITAEQLNKFQKHDFSKKEIKVLEQNYEIYKTSNEFDEINNAIKSTVNMINSFKESIKEGISAFNKAIAKKYNDTEPNGAGQYYLDWRFDLHDEKDNIEAIADRCGVTVEFQSDEGYFEVFEESKKSTRKSLKEKVTDAKSLKIIERALLDLIHDDTIQEEFNMAFEDNGIYDSVDDMFEVSVHNVLNKLLKEHTITVLPF